MEIAVITLIICVVTIVVIIIMVRLCARLTRTHGICCGDSCCKQTGSSGAGSGPTRCAACGALSCTKCVASCHICCRIVCEEIDDSDVEEIHFNLSVFQCVFCFGSGECVLQIRNIDLFIAFQLFVHLFIYSFIYFFSCIKHRCLLGYIRKTN